jgi:hypothetical protein
MYSGPGWIFTVPNLAAAFYPEMEVNNGRIKSEHFVPDKCSFFQAQMSATSTRGLISAERQEVGTSI